MELEHFYNKIDCRGRAAIREHHEQLDEYLANSGRDMRQGLTLVATIPAHVRRNIMFCLQKLAAIEPNQYFYPSSDLHITIIDIIAASPAFELTSLEKEKYKTVVGEVVSQVRPIHWRLAGIITSPGALLVKGYYSGELETLRNLIREKLPQNDLLLKERYKTISGHVTIGRYTSHIKQSERFLGSLTDLKTVNFGQFTTGSLDLVVHDWYNHNSQLISRLPLYS